MKPTLSIIISLIIFNQVYGQVKDIDGNTYKVIKIGNQIWMAENLNVTHFRNGDNIPDREDEKYWEDERNIFTDYTGVEFLPAFCNYLYDSIEAKKYGKLYNWYAVIDPRGLAPVGWHIPSESEWIILAKYLGGYQIFKNENDKTFNVAGKKMRTTSGWGEEYPPLRSGPVYELNKRVNAKYFATNSSGFSALPGGYREGNGSATFIGGFRYEYHKIGKQVITDKFTTGKEASWWSSTKIDILHSISILLEYQNDNIYFKESGTLSGRSIRCIKD